MTCLWISWGSILKDGQTSVPVMMFVTGPAIEQRVAAILGCLLLFGSMLQRSFYPHQAFTARTQPNPATAPRPESLARHEQGRVSTPSRKATFKDLLVTTLGEFLLGLQKGFFSGARNAALRSLDTASSKLFRPFPAPKGCQARAKSIGAN